jgi:GxxExxY protein
VPLVEKQLTGEIIGAFYACHNTLGFGFLESVYRRSLAHDLRDRGLHVREECPVEVSYKGVSVGHFRLDLLVNDRVAIEVKASLLLDPTAKRQLLNYLRASSLEVGLLLHFGPDAKFHRVYSANSHSKQESPNQSQNATGPASPVSSV